MTLLLAGCAALQTQWLPGPSQGLQARLWQCSGLYARYGGHSVSAFLQGLAFAKADLSVVVMSWLASIASSEMRYLA